MTDTPVLHCNGCGFPDADGTCGCQPDAETYIIRGVDTSGNVSFYTGRTGEKWLESFRFRAFGYESKTRAFNKAKGFNAMTSIHGIHFTVQPAL